MLNNEKRAIIDKERKSHDLKVGKRRKSINLFLIFFGACGTICVYTTAAPQLYIRILYHKRRKKSRKDLSIYAVFQLLNRAISSPCQLLPVFRCSTPDFRTKTKRKTHKKSPENETTVLGALKFWCRWWGSNPHDVAITGF